MMQSYRSKTRNVYSSERLDRETEHVVKERRFDHEKERILNLYGAYDSDR